MRTIALAGWAWGLLLAAPLLAQEDDRAADPLPPPGLGSLTQSDLSLRVRNDDIEIRLVPLDERVTRLLARDAYQSLRSLVHSRRASIDSVARRAGLSRPGLALVSFFGLRAGARFDPQTLTVDIRNRVYQPRGIVPFSPRFTSQQLDLREQVTGIYIFEEHLPVTDDFHFSYQGLDSEDWQDKQPRLDRERARVTARARVSRPDSATTAVSP
jgi:hypothetical protein